MKKTVIVIGFVMILIGLLSAETTKNELNIGLAANINKAEEKSFILPYIAHAFEFEKNSFTYGLESEIILDFDKEMENEFVIAVSPNVEYALTELLTSKLALPLEYCDSDLYKNLEAELSFGNLEEDIEGITPWASFEQGANLSSVYSRELEENAENELNLKFDYSFYNENINFMLKPSLIISKELSESDSDVDENFSLCLAKDFTNYLTLNAEIESNFDFDYLSNIEAYFYLSQKLELTISSTFTEDDYEVGIGIDYLIFE
jgi:hypothetical protein